MQCSPEWCSLAQWKDIRPWRPEFGPEGMHCVSKIFIFYFWGSSEAAMGGGGAQRPVCHVNEPNKTGARSARARTRGQNPLVPIMVYLFCCRKICTPILGIYKSLRHMNVEIGSGGAQFLFWEYTNGIFCCSAVLHTVGLSGIL